MAERAPRILLADDEQSIQTLLSFPLRKDGYEVTTAADGREALARFNEGKFDLVVLDVMMPRMDGWATLEHLGETGERPRVIMVTAKTAARDRDRAMGLGVDDFVTKPFEPDHLVERMRRVLERAEAPLPS